MNYYSYSELTPQAKDKAKAMILDLDRVALAKEIARFKAMIATNIHTCVNDLNRMPYFIRRKAHIAKVETDPVYARKYIDGNVCYFREDGRYIPLNERL